MRQYLMPLMSHTTTRPSSKLRVASTGSRATPTPPLALLPGAHCCHTWRTGWLSLWLMLWLLWSATVASAATYTVTNTGDNNGVNPAPNAGTGTLRQAIVDANAAAGDDTISFANNVTGTITLTSALPNLSSNINIQGPGANVLTVQRSGAGGTPSFTIFIVDSGVTATIADLTISGGKNADINSGGGGIKNNGTLTVNNSTISNNSSPDAAAGGILNQSGTLTVNNSTISKNSAAFGGGILNIAGTTTVNNSTIASNDAPNQGMGGGIYNNSGTFTMNNSTIASNFAGDGGGIANFSTLTVNNSTLTDNFTGNRGGGIYNNSGTLTVNNSTIASNVAFAVVGSQQGGGIYNSATLNLSNSIVANNAATTGSDINGTVTAGDYNLVKDIGGVNGTLPGTHNITGQDPVLGPLADNGGPTQTMALRNGSPAIDAGDPAFDGTGKTDQRGPGFARVVHGRLDIGAYEVQHFANFAITKSATPTVLIPGADITYSITLSNNDTQAAPNTTLTDAVPANTTFVSATQNSGPAFTLTTPAVGGTGNVTATNSSLAAGASATFTVVVRVNNNTPDNTTITNTASVSSDYPNIPGAGTATATATAISNTALSGTNGNDTLVVTATGPDSGTYSLNGGPAVPFSNLPQLIFNGGAGNDTLTINNPSGGLFAPAGGITFNGGTQSGAPGDVLQIVGGTETTATYIYTTTDANGHSGTISLVNGGTTAHYGYSGLDPISNSGTATNIVFNLPGTSDSAVLQDLGGGNSQLSSPDGSFETTTFANPGVGGSVTLNAGGGNDNISITPSLNYPVIVDGGPGLDSLNVDLTGVVNPVFASTGPNAGTITFGPAGNRQTITYSNVEVILPTNQPPSNIVPGTQTTLEDAPLTFSTGNGNAIAVSDPDAGTAPVRVTLTVTNGTLTLPATTGLTFNSGSNGTASMVFTGTIANINADLNGLVFTPTVHSRNAGLLTITTNDLGNTGSGGAKSATDNVVINITPINHAPVAINDSYSTAEDTSLIVAAANGVLNNDTDIDGDPLNVTVAGVVGPAHGTLTITSSGSFTYTPAANYNGPDSFTYQANDGTLNSNVATVNLIVTPVNDAPVAVNDAYTTNEDTPLTVNAASGVLANDTDIDGDTLTVGAVVNNPTHGILTVNPNGSFTYTPNANYNGADSFTYRAYDGTALSNNLATVTITVNAVNDAPVAKNDSYTAGEDVTLTINAASGVLANDTDVENSPLTAIQVTAPSHGTLTLNSNGSFTYIPALHYNGPDSFTYKANDGGLDSNVATVNLTVTAINYPPVANNDGFTISEDTPLSITAPGVLSNDTDIENSPLTVGSLVTSPSHGTLGLNADGSLSYVPDTNFNGTDSFTYRAYDGTALSNNLATVTITVTAVNDAPVNNVPGAQSTLEDMALSFSTANGNLISITDVDAGVGNEQVILNVTHGTLNLGSTTGLTVTGNGTANVTLNGTLSNLSAALATLSFTPALHFHSGDTLTITTNDGGNTGTGGAKTATSTVNITITHVNHAPVATADAYTTAEDTPLNATAATGVLANDTDIDGDTLKAILLNGPANGILTLNGDGSFTYTPDADFNGSDSFTYHVFDGSTFSNTVTVTLTITAVNDAPVNTVPGAQSVNQDTPLVFSTTTNNLISVNDVDAGTNAVQVTLSAANGTVMLATLNGLTVIGGSNGGATVTVSGTLANLNAALNGLRFTPGAGFSGAAAVTITTNDLGNTGAGGAKSTSSTVPITVNAVARTLSINSVSVLEGDSGVTPATFTVTLSAPSTVPVSVQFATSDGTAKAGSDYLSTSGTLTFAPGETTKTVAVSVVGDTIQEDNETLLVLLSKPTGGATISTNAGIGTIIDDDGPPVLAINDVSLSEGNSGTTNMTFMVTLTAPSGKPVSVDYVTADATAKAGSDYTSTNGTLTFAPGQTSKTISVPIIGDTTVEPNETLLVKLSNAVGAPVSRSQGTGTILNDDQAPSPPVLNVSFSNVGNGDVYRSLPTLVGNVAESLAPANTILNVQVSIQRQSDGKYFSGSSWSATPTFFPATLANGVWTLAAGVLPSNSPNSQFLIDDKYNLTAIATDNGGRSASASITLIIDHTPPTITITTPPDKALLSTLTAIGGKIADAPGGTGVQKVLLTLVRVSDGKQWNGASFITPPTLKGKVQSVVFLASGDVSKGTYARRSGLPNGSNLTPGDYRLTAIAVDGASNRGQADSAFTIKGSGSSTPSPASTVALSTSKASAATSSVQLRFLGALNAESAGDASHYSVTVNGKAVAVESAGYNASIHSVTLSLPDGSLHVGDKVTVKWSGLQDSKGAPVTGQVNVQVPTGP